MMHQLSNKLGCREFLRGVEELSGQAVSACYQCGKCTAGCPVVADLDPSPNRVMRLIQLGSTRDALRNEMVWLCVGCGACGCRCPIGIDPGRVMDTLRALAREMQVPPPPASAPIYTFFQAFLDSVREFGRLSEVALMGSYNINSGRLLTNVIKAPWFVLRGKLSIAPHSIKKLDRLDRVFQRIGEIESA